MTRFMIPLDQAVDLVEKYDGKVDEHYIEKFCKYIGISTGKFWKVAEEVRNKDLWNQDPDGNWTLKYPIRKLKRLI